MLTDTEKLDRLEKLRKYQREYQKLYRLRMQQGAGVYDDGSEAAAKLAALKQNTIGLIAIMPGHGLDVHVRVLDVKSNFRQYNYLVEPVAGSGKTWIRKIKPLPVQK